MSIPDRASAILACMLAIGMPACTAQRAASPASYVILVSFDGFRYDYPDRGVTPVLDSLAREGVRADGLIPVMPTKTFPNHYSIATGMYSSEHRLVANVFRDPQLGIYSPADRSTVENGEWYAGEPAWVAAQRQGLRTASMFWVGTEADVRGVRPDHARVPHTRTYERTELPIEWHWSDPRLGDLITVADPGWLIAPAPAPLPAGAHGWPPTMREMQGVFVAGGAGVSAGERIPAFENVHIHAFVAGLLGIAPGSGAADAGPLRRAR